jgi:hypothetical protein
MPFRELIRGKELPAGSHPAFCTTRQPIEIVIIRND